MEKRIGQVAVITTTFPTHTNGSLGVFVANLVTSLNKYINVLVVTPSYKGQRQYRVKNIPVYPFRYAPASCEILAHDPGGIPVALKKNKWLYLIVPLLLLALLCAAWKYGRKSQLLHANWAICGAMCGIVARLINRPLVTTLRGDDVTRAKGSRIDAVFLSMAVRLSDKVVTVSGAIAEYLIQSYPWASDKIVAIYNGVDDAFITNGAERQVRDTPTLHLLTVANLIERKGIDQILHAIALLDDPERIQFAIVGEGPEGQKLQDLARHLGIEKQVLFVGSKSPDMISQFMDRADVFILASRSEGRANVLIEAMASGLAVIASDIDGSRELVGDPVTGLLFPVGDIKKLAENINYFYDATRRFQYGQAAHKYVLDAGLTWDNTAREYIHHYTMITER